MSIRIMGINNTWSEEEKVVAPRQWHVWVDSNNKISSSEPDDFHPELITVREVLPEDK